MKGLKEDDMLSSRQLCTGSDMSGREKEPFLPFYLIFQTFLYDCFPIISKIVQGQERTASLFSLMWYILLVYFFQGITFSMYLLNGLYLTNAHLSERHSNLIQRLREFPMFSKTLKITSVCQEPPLAKFFYDSPMQVLQT